MELLHLTLSNIQTVNVAFEMEKSAGFFFFEILLGSLLAKIHLGKLQLETWPHYKHVLEMQL